MRKLLFLLVISVIGFAVFFYFRDKPPLFVELAQITSIPMYKAADTVNAQVSIFDESVSQVTQIDISPDGNYMLVGTLPGTVWVYHKVDGVFRRQLDPFFVVETAHPGFPPKEAGLTGVIYGTDFATSGDVFLAYSFAAEEKSYRNRITRVTFTKKGGRVVGITPQQIFEANTPGAASHQIQDGVGVMVRGVPHVLFTIGEGHKSERSLDSKEESGKVILISRDGSAPIGDRPFLESPKVQALGVRNAPAMALNPINNKIAIADTGPDNYDRFLYGKMYDAEGKNTEKLSFNWDGTENSLRKGSSDLYDLQKEMVIYRWAPTETAVNIAFYENNSLPTLKSGQQYVLIVLFGRTGEIGSGPGKKILLGTLEEGKQNLLTSIPLIVRTPEGEGQLGHPLGLGVDPATHDFYFGDIMEGRIYKVSI